MARRKKQSISTFLVSALGFLFMCKVFIWVLETQIMHVPIHIPELNYAFAGVAIALLLRIGFVWWMARRKKASFEKEVAAPAPVYNLTSNSHNTCAACGKTVSEKVKQFCLSRPGRFQGKIFCYDHQS
ncbi:hypothetical protein [Paenibacillus silviterrae]|uniref:hypothetical protein n=1 Tax=Paenibacillus silviterrae TaxID=3242194 RepID=UPI002543D016|nr:hypothetical protein [Paenibacillus chinjuensis]